MADHRKLEKTKTPGIYRRHAAGCKGDGRCHCPYVVVWKHAGKQHKQMFRTFALAAEHKSKIGSGQVTRRPLSSQTVGAYYEGWFENYRGRTSRGLEGSTKREYEISFRLHILPLPIGRMRMRDLGAPEVMDWFTELEKAGVSPRTIRKAKAALSVMLASAVEGGAIPSNPAISARYVPSDRTKRKHPARKRRKLTKTDVEAILRALPDQWRVFFLFLTQTGVRIGEALGLTWENVHLGDDPYILVAEQVYEGQRKQLKTDASEARLPLSPTMATMLSRLPREADEAPVFPSTTGTPLSYANLYNRVLQPALKDAGMDGQGVAFHAFRKACGSLLLANGKRDKQVQGWLRHSQLSTTQNVYIHEVDDGLGGADVWEDILPGWGNPGATGPLETPVNQAPARTGETVD